MISASVNRRPVSFAVGQTIPPEITVATHESKLYIHDGSSFYTFAEIGKVAKMKVSADYTDGFFSKTVSTEWMFYSKQVAEDICYRINAYPELNKRAQSMGTIQDDLVAKLKMAKLQLQHKGPLRCDEVDALVRGIDASLARAKAI
jgi:hypothetical protein